MEIPDGYEMHLAAPSAEDFAMLRREAGLSPVTPEQASIAVAGGWMFQVTDMAVHPQHQRQGLGDAILTRLLQEIADRAPAGAYVSLMADPPGRRLYARHGFQDRHDVSAGMFCRMP